MTISKIYLEEEPVDDLHPFGDNLKKIARENLGLFILDDNNRRLRLDKLDSLTQIANNNAVPYKFTYTSKNFKFVPPNNSSTGKQILLGKVYLRVNYYGATYGKHDTTHLRIHILDRIYKSPY